MLLNGLILVGFIVLPNFLLGTLREGERVLMGMHITILTTLTVVFILLRRGMVPRKGAAVICGLVFLVFSYLVLTGGSGGSGALWLNLFPLMTLYMFGIRIGMIWSLVLIATCGVIMFWPGLLQADYTISFKARVIGTYAMATFMSSMFEVVRGKTLSALEKTQSRLLDERKQINSILENTHEGLFLIGDNLKIGAHYSQAMEIILPGVSISGQSLMDILKNHIPGSIHESIETYLKFFFDLRKNVALLDDLNPLDEISLKWNGSIKILQFKFSRIKKEKINILGTLRDVTTRRDLEQQLQNAQEKQKKEMETIGEIIQTESRLLKDFLIDAQEEIIEINDLGERLLTGTPDSATRESLFQSLHSLKGNSGLIGLTQLTRLLHDSEEYLAEARAKNDLDSSWQETLKIHIENLDHEFNNIKRFIDNLVNLNNAAITQERRGKDLLTANLIKLVDRTSQNLNKEAHLNISGFSTAWIPQKNKRIIKNILVHLIRNSLAHGIETPAERKKSQKPEAGTLLLKAKVTRDHATINLRDDGGGLKVGKIKSRALAQGLFSTETLDCMPTEDIYQIIFHPGFSTLKKADETAGRGVGMSYVKEKIKFLGGSITMTSSENSYTEIKIILPL